MVAPTANQIFMGLPEPLEAPTKYAPDVILKIELALTVLLEFFCAYQILLLLHGQGDRTNYVFTLL